jgi:hypothetical protein
MSALATVSVRSYARSRRARGLPVASHTGLQKAISEGILRPPALDAAGKVVPKHADEQLRAQHPLSGAIPSRSSSPLAEVRRQREELKLKSEQLEYHRRAGRLVEAAPVLAKVRSASRQLRDRLMLLTTRVLPQCAGLTLHEQILTMEAAIRDDLDAFAQDVGSGVARAVEREKSGGVR